MGFSLCGLAGWLLLAVRLICRYGCCIMGGGVLGLFGGGCIMGGLCFGGVVLCVGGRL